jgi:hypothetical protein
LVFGQFRVLGLKRAFYGPFWPDLAKKHKLAIFSRIFGFFEQFEFFWLICLFCPKIVFWAEKRRFKVILGHFGQNKTNQPSSPEFPVFLSFLSFLSFFGLFGQKGCFGPKRAIYPQNRKFFLKFFL